MTPNVKQIREQKIRIIRGRIPFGIRNELYAAVKTGELGRLKKDGLKPEIFFHPDHKHAAQKCQHAEAESAILRISKALA